MEYNLTANYQQKMCYHNQCLMQYTQFELLGQSAKLEKKKKKERKERKKGYSRAISEWTVNELIAILVFIFSYHQFIFSCSCNLISFLSMKYLNLYVLSLIAVL
jgi:hypothetical protein